MLFCQKTNPDIFNKITAEVANFKVDTSAVPQDRLIAEIIELRQAKGRFNNNEAIVFKISEDHSKGNLTADKAKNMETFFTIGKGKTWLDNAVMRIYRTLFTLSEIEKLTRFYRSSAGQKFAEMIVDGLKKGHAKAMIKNN
ncbi:hypothetical protein ASG01_14250 [Chryseobacterium sp. Leaf180]|jgi:hypothetical protein|nr:hypothetical protein ASG01_14250 [Chryseobacterium sp. Leaf180]